MDFLIDTEADLNLRCHGHQADRNVTIFVRLFLDRSFLRTTSVSMQGDGMDTLWRAVGIQTTAALMDQFCSRITATVHKYTCKIACTLASPMRHLYPTQNWTHQVQTLHAIQIPASLTHREYAAKASTPQTHKMN